jgi:hypothetical protein
MIKAWIENGILQCASGVCEMKSCPRFATCVIMRAGDLLDCNDECAFAENKRLQKINSQLKEENKMLLENLEIFQNDNMNSECNLAHVTSLLEMKEEEIKQLKEALRKCSPFKTSGHCKFCSSDWIALHEINCEYLRLTKESEV